MPENNKRKNSSRNIGIIGIAGTAVGFFSNPGLAGFVGLGKAMMIGGATSFGAGVFGFIGIKLCTAVGSFVTGGKEIGKTIGYIVGASAGVVYGGIQGYEFGEKAIIDPCNQTTSLNIQSQDAFNVAAEKNTLVLKAEDFALAPRQKPLALAA